jgi:hypothetical protein
LLPTGGADSDDEYGAGGAGDAVVSHVCALSLSLPVGIVERRDLSADLWSFLSLVV